MFYVKGVASKDPANKFEYPNELFVIVMSRKFLRYCSVIFLKSLRFTTLIFLGRFQRIAFINRWFLPTENLL